MRIALFNQRMERGYGVALTLYETARELAERGFDITFYTTAVEGFDLSEFRVEKLEIPGGETNRFLPLYQHRTTGILRELGSEFVKFDWLVLGSFPFFSLAELARESETELFPRVLWWDFGSPPPTGFSLMGRLNWHYRNWCEQNWLPLADERVTISRFLRGDLPEGQRRGTTVLKLGGDHLSRCESEPPERLDQLTDEEFVALSVARLDPENHPYKGLGELMECHRKLRRTHPRCRLVVAGRAERPAELEEWLDEGVVAVPNPDDGELRALYERADLYISASRWEGWNLPILEAGWFGTAALAYDVGAHAENVTRFLVEPERHLLEQKWKQLADHPQTVHRAGRRVKEQAREHTWGSTVRQLREVLEG